MIHGLLTAVWCLACLWAGLPWPFLFWPPAFYLGREVSQAEYRYLTARDMSRTVAPWWIGFLPSAWTAKGVLDWLLPLGVAAISWIAAAVCL